MIKDRLNDEKDLETLKSLVPEAARAGSIEAFIKVLDDKKIPQSK